MDSLVQRTGTATVVVIDDAADIRDLVRLSLEAGGRFAVVGEADNGRVGIDVVSRAQPDLVFLDLRMPVMDGMRALPRIKRACPATRVVVLSGFESETMEPRVRAAGADGFAQKGISPRDLVSYAEVVLARPPALAARVPRQGR